MKLFALVAYTIMNGQVTLSHTAPGIYGFYATKAECEQLAYQWQHREPQNKYACEPVFVTKKGK